MAKVGFLGLGEMGTPMANRISAGLSRRRSNNGLFR
jgi:3-hydroxyisobutyrate dehydrogenase-like beta-hydroxyacid dehydrogenase